MRAHTAPQIANADSVAFITAVAVGALAIFGLKPLGASQLTVTGVVCGLVVVYAFAVTRINRVKLRYDQAGDNSYYLGLVFTLLSMVRALTEVGAAAAAADGKGLSVAEAIIGDFGIALGSTLVGIVTRLVLQQMRIDAADVEHTMRIELAEAATNMRSHLNAIVSTVGTFHAELTQAQEDYIEEVRSSYKAVADEAARHIREAAERASSDLVATSKGIGDAVTEFAGRADGLSRVLTEATARLTDIEAPRAKLGKSFTTLAERIDATSERLRANDQTLAASLSQITDATGHFRAAMAAMVELTSALRVASERTDERVRAAVASMDGTTERMARSVNHFEAAVSRMDVAIDVTAEKAAATMTGIEAHVAGAGEYAAGVIARIETEAANVAASAAASQAAADAASAAASSVITGLKSAVDELDQRVQQATP